VGNGIFVRGICRELYRLEEAIEQVIDAISRNGIDLRKFSRASNSAGELAV